MRTITLILLLVCSVSAQIPRTISFQGVLTDAQGNLVLDGNHALTLKLYDNVSSQNPLYTETQTVPVVKGVFNVIIGSVTALPASIAFDRAYFLGVAVDGGLELAPRTALTAVPYAIRADRANIAEALAPSATGVVTSINNQSGAVTMQGGGGTTVTNVGNAFTISSVGGGGTGIQGVQSTDGSLAIQNPNGPVANLSVASNAITQDKIATGQVVKSINNLKDNVTLSAGSNVTITPNGNTLTISSSGGSSGVTSVNNVTGAVTLAASGGATINTAGNTITINAGSGGGGTGIQGVQNTDNTLDITNPNGPTATINLKGQGITSVQLADNAVTALKIAEGTITSSKLAPGVIPSTLPPSGGAGGDLSGTYPNPAIAANSVTSTKIADGAIATSDLADNIVTSSKIVDGTIATSDLANESVTSVKLAPGVIPATLPPNGAAGGSLTGAYPNPGIAANAINSSNITDATVVTADLADNSVTSAKIVDGTVGTSDIASSSITSLKIADGTIGNLDLADISVTSNKIAGSGATSGQVLSYNGSNVVWSNLPSGGGTLDQAYDFGGTGNGRTITADAGAVLVAGIDGFISTGTNGSGATLPVSGSGTRLIWYPKKSAFRAGGATGSNWDDGNIGSYSIAVGIGTKASGIYSVALGDGTTASGQNATAIGHSTSATNMYSTAMGSGTNATGESSTALGFGTDANGSSATAMGYQTTASANISTAMGYQTTASGNTSTAIGSSSTASGNQSIAIGTSVIGSGSRSTAMGNFASTNSQDGAFVIGDNSTTTVLNATTPQQFRTRFSGGYQLWTNSAMSIGARLDANATSWATLSDSTMKCNFKRADGENILSRFSTLRLGSWNYKANQDASNRHYGTMAQEWFSAFGHDGVGTIGNDTTLATADVDGVLCIAIQTLEKRTSVQKEIIAKQEVELNELRERLRRLETRFANDRTQSSASTVTSHARSSE